MYCAKLTIPKISDTYKLYVYRAKSAESINTISKVKELSPIIVIDESIAETQIVNDVPCYIVNDKNNNDENTGITYNGPVPNLVPTTEYESKINIVPLNNYTYVNELILNPLPIKYNGTMLYYSVIGVDETNNLITHLSKVNGVMINSDYQEEGVKHLYSCDEYTGTDADIWKYVTSVQWTEEIKIGNITDDSLLHRFGIPVVNDIHIFNSDDVNVATKHTASSNFMVLEIPNPWKRNNQEYNYRKLKSFKLQNVCDEQYSDFSEPTFQSLLPVSLEKMLILRKDDAENPEQIITIDETLTDNTIKTYEIIRKDGIFYNKSKHRKLGLNKYNIPIEENTGIFSESSVQDEIKKQVEALPNHIYSFTIYLIDVYNNISKPVHFTVQT